jgi:hypothetical protein
MNLLERKIAEARAEAVAWDSDRASRVFSATLRVREGRVRRARAFRRALVVGSAGALLLLLVFRSSAAPTTQPSTALTSTDDRPSDARVALMLGDGGYGRD